MAEPTLICPQCKTEIKLTESLAAPLLADVRRQFEQRLAQKDIEVAKREISLNERAEAIEKAKLISISKSPRSSSKSVSASPLKSSKRPRWCWATILIKKLKRSAHCKKY